MAIAEVCRVALYALKGCCILSETGCEIKGLSIESALFLGYFLALLTYDCA
jgi:hypothetical protein